jgi:Flavodoxin reductases (ferredoxin-NADPH reductases) family 1
VISTHAFATHAATSLVLRGLTGAARWLTTPLLPEDYLGLFDPLWSTTELRGRVEAVRPETADAATLVIRPGRGWRPHRAGQWIRIGVDVDGRRHWRTYSLSSPPGRADGLITITVKAVPGGRVSRHLVRGTPPGTIVGLDLPQGDFVLPDPVPSRLLFLTAGSGITPVMAILEDLLSGARPGGPCPAGGHAVPGHAVLGRAVPGRAVPDIVLVHSAPTARDVIFGARLRDLAARIPQLRLHERHTRTAGRFRPAELDRLCPDWAERDTWACGPAGMLDEIIAHWAGREDRLRVERFRTAVAAPAAGEGLVRFTRSGREVAADDVTPLLTVGEDAGILMPSGCRAGICHGCLVPLRSGRVRDLRTGRVHGEDGDLIQTCVSAAAGTVEIDI